MWQIEYSSEAKFYFIDNDPYAFELLIRIEELKYATDGLPPEGCTALEDGMLWWEVLHHVVIYERELDKPQRLVILVVKPL